LAKTAKKLDLQFRYASHERFVEPSVALERKVIIIVLEAKKLSGRDVGAVSPDLRIC
jgi:hypothetical protein